MKMPLIPALVVVCLGYAVSPAVWATEISAASAPVTATYQVSHALEVTGIAPGARVARIWFWLPDDDDCQKLLDLSVSKAPGGYAITRDAENGHQYLYVQVEKPAANLKLLTQFTIRRSSISVSLDPAKAGPLTAVHRQEFAEYLRRDVPNMEVTPHIIQLADQICGGETNVVRQARMLFGRILPER